MNEKTGAISQELLAELIQLDFANPEWPLARRGLIELQELRELLKPGPIIEADKLQMFPIEQHPRTLHALIVAQLATVSPLRTDKPNRESQLRHYCEVASEIIEYSREQTNGQ